MIRNADRLREVLSDPRRLARAFSRHTYGMLAWVDILGAKLGALDNPGMCHVAERVIADNKKHARLFSERARELGEKPEAYRPPQIGQKIYDILESYHDPFDEFAYALGSLLHFSSLLELYHGVADPESRIVIEEVQRDVDEHLSFLKRYFEVSADTPEKKKRAEEVIAIAEGIYADREEVEAEWYAS